MTPKLPPDQRKAIILSAAIKVANEKGLHEVTFQTVAEECKITTSQRTVSSYFKIGELRRAVIDDDRANDEVRIDAVAWGID